MIGSILFKHPGTIVCLILSISSYRAVEGISSVHSYILLCYVKQHTGKGLFPMIVGKDKQIDL